MVSESLAQRALPLVTFESAEIVGDYGQAVWDAGLRVIEVGFRTSEAPQAVSRMRSETQLTVVAGTLTSIKAVDQAIDAGAHWGIAPNYDSSVLDHAQARGFSLVPGIATPTELGDAVRRGLSYVKVYPVSALGGIPYLSSLHAVFPDIHLIPSGGVALALLPDYLSVRGVAAVSGSWLPSVPTEAETVDFVKIGDVITELLSLVPEGP